MKNLTVGIVAEGPTDVNMISELVTQIIPGNHRFLPIQPDISATEGFGAYGAGWKGVLAWCKSISGNMIDFITHGNPMDLLIIHLDADVSRESEIDCSKPCPEAMQTVLALQYKVLDILQSAGDDKRLHFCIPSDNMEAWILCAFDSTNLYHYPPERPLECLKKPEYILCQRPFNLLKMKDGKPKKNQVKYREELIPKVLEEWDRVKGICSEAQRFEQGLIGSVAANNEGLLQ